MSIERVEYSERTRELQREALAALEALTRSVAEDQVRWETESGDDVQAARDAVEKINSATMTGFIGMGQWQFMTGDPEDSMALAVSIGLTRWGETGLIHCLMSERGR